MNFAPYPSVETYTAQIYIGLRRHYSESVHDIKDLHAMCQGFVDLVGLCVTVTPTTFIYTNKGTGGKGSEPGAIVGLINYPRFPSRREDIRAKAIELAELLLRGLGQQRVSVVFPEETVMISEDERA